MGVTKKSQQKVSRMHNGKNRTNRKVCKVCNGKHPTTLHELVLRKGNSQKSQKSRMYQGIIKI